MYKLLFVLYFGLLTQTVFCQSRGSPLNYITEFLSARCSRIDNWAQPQDSSKVLAFSKFIAVYDFPIPVPYSIYLFNDLDDGIIKFDSGFASDRPISLPVSRYYNTATIFFDDQKPCFLLVSPGDSLFHFSFFQSCVVHY